MTGRSTSSLPILNILSGLIFAFTAAIWMVFFAFHARGGGSGGSGGGGGGGTRLAPAAAASAARGAKSAAAGSVGSGGTVDLVSLPARQLPAARQSDVHEERRNDDDGGSSASPSSSSYVLLYPNSDCSGDEPLRIDVNSKENNCERCRDLCHEHFPGSERAAANDVGVRISARAYGGDGKYAVEILKDCRGTWEYDEPTDKSSDIWTVHPGDKKCSSSPFGEGAAHVRFVPLPTKEIKRRSVVNVNKKAPPRV